MSEARGWSVFWRADKRRWVVTYVDPAGKPKQKVVTADIPPSRKADAERWVRAWFAEKSIRPGEVLARLKDKGRTMRELLPDWERVRKKSVADKMIAMSTMKDSLTSMRRWVVDEVVDREVLGDLPIAEFDALRARKWLIGIRGRGAINSTRNRYFAFVQFYNDAIAEGWVHTSVNPLNHESVVREVPVQRRHKTAKETRIIKLEVAQKLISSPKVPLQRRVRTAVAFGTGERDGELAGLLFKDVQIDEGQDFEVLIDKALSWKGPDGFATMGNTKTKQHRRVPLPAFAAAALREWRDSGWAELIGRSPKPTDAIFVSSRGPRKGKASRSNSAKTFREDLVAVGFASVPKGQTADNVLGDYDFHHSTRASLISWLTRLQVRETVIQRIVGQAGEGVTQVHYVEEEWTSMVEALALLPLQWIPNVPEEGADGGHNVGPAEPHSAQPQESMQPQADGAWAGHQEAEPAGECPDAALESQADTGCRPVRKPQVWGSNPQGGSGGNVASGADALVTTATSAGSVTVDRTESDPLSSEDPPPRVAGLAKGLAGLRAGDAALERFWASEVEGVRARLAYTAPALRLVDRAEGERLVATAVAS